MVLALGTAAAGQGGEVPPPVDLSGQEYVTIAEAQRPAGEEVTGFKRWFERVRIGGYGSFAYLQTGSDGKRPDGALLVNQASLFLDVDVSADAALRFEILTDRWHSSSSSEVEIGETYADLFDVVDLDEDGYVVVRVGRFDIPFGEYYRYEDAPENPLFSFPIAMPYMPDEGVMAYGDLRGLGYNVAFLDGSYDRSSDDGIAGSAVARVSGEPLDGLYVSGSFLWNGETGATALCFSGVTLKPVGVSGSSTLGSSLSTEISATAYEVDARYSFGDRAYVHLSVGHARVDDDDNAFDRDFTWFVVEPSVLLTPALRATVRYSEVGTYDGDEGYRFEGRPYGNGVDSYGYDTKRASRLAAGLAWTFRPDVILKAEGGFDRWEPISQSALSTDYRGFVGVELVLSF